MTLRRLATVLLTTTLLAGGCSLGRSVGPTAAPSTAPSTAPSVPVPTTAAPVQLTWTACEPGFECSVLPVPLDEADPARGTVDLALTRKPAPGPGQRIGSLLINPGGPGASAVDFVQGSWQQIPAAVRAQFDLVAFDPRGVGRSAPVRCGTTSELDAYFALDPVPDDPAELSAYVEGNRALVQGCSARSGQLLPYVSTDEAARDLDRVRAAVGDERLTYLGYSYGTSIGAAYLRLFPQRARALVLDGAIDPTLTWDRLLEGQSTGFDVALQAFLADCERTRCPFRQAVSGDLPAAYDRLAAQVDRQPLPGEGTRTVGPGEFSLGVGAGLYSRANGWPAIAQGLAAAVAGDGRTLLALSDSYLERTASGYANVSEANLAVNCLDRPWPRETQPYVDLADRVRAVAPRFGPAIALSGLGCATWPVPAVSVPAPVRAEGSPPVVVIGTTRDPATPYAWAQALAGQLAAGVLVSYDGDGHTVYRTGAPDCVRAPVDSYLLTAQAPAAPVRC